MEFASCVSVSFGQQRYLCAKIGQSQERCPTKRAIDDAAFECSNLIAGPIVILRYIHPEPSRKCICDINQEMTPARRAGRSNNSGP